MDRNHLREQLLASISREAAKGEMAIDSAAYAAARRDPTEPVLFGSGSLSARLGFFGRDPGKVEVERGEPFVGKGGQLVRSALYRAVYGDAGNMSFEDSLAVGRRVFWANTVPFKPLGNKAWSTAVKRRFLPDILRSLTELWEGEELITLGNQAFFWFALAQPSLKPELDRYWARQDRYEASLTVELSGRRLTLYPLPHPSPLNATWHAHFPAMLDRRLEELRWRGA